MVESNDRGAPMPAPDRAREHGQSARYDPLAAELAGVLERLHAEHERLGLIASARRRAIALADARALAACVGQENDAVQRIAAIDRERSDLATRAVRRFGAPAGSPTDWRPTLSWIAANFPDPQRAALADAAARLRERIERLREENHAVADAARALAGHMLGLVRTAEGRLSHSGAYSRGGVVHAGPAVQTAMDVTS